MKKLTGIWDSLPKEIRVIPYVVISGAAVALYQYLQTLEVDSEKLGVMIAMGVVNIFIVFHNLCPCNTYFN